MQLHCYLYSFLLLSYVLSAQTIEVVNRLGEPALVFENDELKEPDTDKALYTIKGNIIFRGKSDKQSEIELLVSAENIFSKKKTGQAFNAAQSEIVFSMRDGGFYYRNKTTYSEQWLMARYIKEAESIDLYLHNSDTLVCRIQSREISTGKLVAIFYHYAKKFEWENEMKQRAAAEIEPVTAEDTAQTASLKNTSGSIRKLWNTGLDEFEWDGSVFRRRWNSFDYEEWTFDGVTLKRLWYPGQEEMEWNGEILKRKWFSSEDEFEWDGSVLRRRYGPASEGYVIQGNIVKPAFGSNLDHEWEIDGTIPVPLIALVVFGLLRK